MKVISGAVADWVFCVIGHLALVLCALFPRLAEHWGDVDYEECE